MRQSIRKTNKPNYRTNKTDSESEKEKAMAQPLEDIYSEYKQRLNSEIGIIHKSNLEESAFIREILKLFFDYFCVSHKMSLKDLVDYMEKIIIIRALCRFNGNQREARPVLENQSHYFKRKN